MVGLGSDQKGNVMECWAEDGGAFLRLDPGDELLTSVIAAANRLKIRSASVTSGVGMFNGVTLGFFEADRDSYVHHDMSGVFDVSVITGNITMGGEGEPAAHIHAVFNDTNHHTISGHVIRAVCHVTAEIFFQVVGLDLRRERLQDVPATRVSAS